MAALRFCEEKMCWIICGGDCEHCEEWREEDDNG